MFSSSVVMKCYSTGIFQLFTVRERTKIVEILQYYNISSFPTITPGITLTVHLDRTGETGLILHGEP